MRTDLPSGNVTFLFTDVEGSTGLLRELGAERYAEALDAHRRVVRGACRAYDGVEVDTQGDAFFLAFPTAAGAVRAAEEIATALDGGSDPVADGAHTGAPLVTAEGYVGEDVHLAARVAAAGHGGQILVTEATAVLAERSFVELGEHRLKDVEGTVRILQVGSERFPALMTVSNTNLPLPPSSFVGRERELADVLARSPPAPVCSRSPGRAGRERRVSRSRPPACSRRSTREACSGSELAALRDPARVHDDRGGARRP